MTHVLVVAPTARELAGATNATSVVGIGRVSEDATRRAIASHKPDLLLSIGFSGALDPELRTGDLVVSQSTLLVHGLLDRMALSASFVGLARQCLISAGLRATVGDNVTTFMPLTTAEQKHKHRSGFEASVVDIETFWIAKAAAEAGVPMLSVRTVIDEARDAIPKFAVDIIIDSGRNELRHALRALLNPLNIGPMVKMARQSRNATASTKAMLSVLLPALAETPAAASVRQ